MISLQLHLAACEDSISSSPGANLNMLEIDLNTYFQISIFYDKACKPKYPCVKIHQH